MKRRWKRLLLLPLVFIVPATYSAVHSAVIRIVEDPPPDPPPAVTSATATSATVDYNDVEWGQSGTVNVDIQRNAAGALVLLTLKDSDGNVLATINHDQAMAVIADTTNALPNSSLMANGTNSTSSGSFNFSQPITSVFGAAVTVNGTVTWH